MRSIVCVTLAIMYVILGSTGTVRAADADNEDKDWTVLFDGKDLSAWRISRTAQWIVEDGAIVLKNRTDGTMRNVDYLWTKEKYADFILELEFKVPERANSGVFLRTADLKEPVFTGIELQVTNSYGRELSRGGTAGAVYDCLAPTKNAIKKPGKWNKYRITCDDNMIVVVLNGERIVEMDLNRWTEKGKNPDGSPNKFGKPLKNFARNGYIGFQDHGRPVWYRNVRIKRLDY